MCLPGRCGRCGTSQFGSNATLQDECRGGLRVDQISTIGVSPVFDRCARSRGVALAPRHLPGAWDDIARVGSDALTLRGISAPLGPTQ